MMENDVWSLAIKSTIAGQLHVNTFQYIETFNAFDLSPQQTAIDLAAIMAFEVDLTYMPLIPDTGTVDQVEVRGITHPAIGFTEIIGAPGTHTGSQLLPPQDALVISKLTDKFGKSYRGRNYLGGNLEDDQSAGLFGPFRLLAAEQFWGDVVALFAQDFSLTFAMAVYSKAKGEATLVSSLRFNTISRGQRRRQLGVGA